MSFEEAHEQAVVNVQTKGSADREVIEITDLRTPAYSEVIYREKTP